MHNNFIFPLWSKRGIGASENSSDLAQTKSPPWTHSALAIKAVSKRHQALQENIKAGG